MTPILQSPLHHADDWYRDAIIYELYVRAFRDTNGDGHGDLQGVTESLDYLASLGVDTLWLLPIHPSPLKDDGYDVADFYGIHPDYGTLQDFKRLVDEAHARGLRVITDLVLNHTSIEHPWFSESRASKDNPKRDWYVWSETDDKYPETRIIFSDFESSNWTYDPVSGEYYWHRFFHHQPDLNYDNPEVRDEMLRVVKHWLDLGIDGFRMDAVPYLFEREGTLNESLPETHDFLKEIRTLVDSHYPGTLLLGEVNQWPEDTVRYFGDGCDELNMLFHFPIMPRLFKALAEGRRDSVSWILEHTPDVPEPCQWAVFLRNHDELTLEMVTEAEREYLREVYAPESSMAINDGIRRRLAPLLDNDPRRIKLMNALLMSLPGTPILYYGDEIGMGDNLTLPDRNGVRHPDAVAQQRRCWGWWRVQRGRRALRACQQWPRLWHRPGQRRRARGRPREPAQLAPRPHPLPQSPPLFRARPVRSFRTRKPRGAPLCKPLRRRCLHRGRRRRHRGVGLQSDR